MSNFTREWVTSDIHFSHGKLLQYPPRTHFKDINEMNEEIISNWNSLVGDNDLVYILGDISFDTPRNTMNILCRLNGSKIIVRGNHDNRLLKDKVFEELRSAARILEVHNYLELHKHKLGFIVMMHFPIESWNNMKHGSFMLHGHLHGHRRVKQGRIADVGMDTNELRPYRLEDIIRGLKWQWRLEELKSHHEVD